MSGPMVVIGEPRPGRTPGTALRTITATHSTSGDQVDIGLIIARQRGLDRRQRFEVLLYGAGTVGFYRDLAGAESGVLEFVRRWRATSGDVYAVIRPRVP